MSTRPSNKEFIQWVENDHNKSKVQNALRAHPDLANVKNSVSFNQLNFLLLLFSHFNFHCNTNGLMCK